MTFGTNVMPKNFGKGKALACLRPLPTGTSGTPSRARLRGRDNVICLCGKPNCRDYDLYLKRQTEK